MNNNDFELLNKKIETLQEEKKEINQIIYYHSIDIFLIDTVIILFSILLILFSILS
jgi:hypothetical protein